MSIRSWLLSNCVASSEFLVHIREVVGSRRKSFNAPSGSVILLLICLFADSAHLSLISWNFHISHQLLAHLIVEFGGNFLPASQPRTQVDISRNGTDITNNSQAE